MGIRRFQDLIAWQLARELERRVFAFTAMSPANRDVDYCRQIRASASSAPRNMAEGFGRYQPGEFAHKMRIAKGELQETFDHLDKALEQQYVASSDHAEMVALANRAIGASTNFVRYLEEAAKRWKRAARPKGARKPRTRN